MQTKVLTGNLTTVTSVLVASTRKSIQKSTSSCLAMGCSVVSFTKCLYIKIVSTIDLRYLRVKGHKMGQSHLLPSTPFSLYRCSFYSLSAIVLIIVPPHLPNTFHYVLNSRYCYMFDFHKNSAKHVSERWENSCLEGLNKLGPGPNISLNRFYLLCWGSNPGRVQDRQMLQNRAPFPATRF